MLQRILKFFRRSSVEITPLDTVDSLPEEEGNFIWCLVGNIIPSHIRGTEQTQQSGTSHFSPHTKVYCFPPLWGDGYENIKVIGRHRGSNKYACIIMPSKLITNWRLQKVYRPYILKVMKSQQGWTKSNTDKETILKMLEWLPERTLKN